jgi:hypothetical protein
MVVSAQQVIPLQSKVWLVECEDHNGGGYFIVFKNKDNALKHIEENHSSLYKTFCITEIKLEE